LKTLGYESLDVDFIATEEHFPLLRLSEIGQAPPSLSTSHMARTLDFPYKKA
jgi:hypothetical protein